MEALGRETLKFEMGLWAHPGRRRRLQLRTAPRDTASQPHPNPGRMAQRLPAVAGEHRLSLPQVPHLLNHFFIVFPSHILSASLKWSLPPFPSTAIRKITPGKGVGGRRDGAQHSGGRRVAHGESLREQNAVTPAPCEISNQASHMSDSMSTEDCVGSGLPGKVAYLGIFQDSSFVAVGERRVESTE